MFAFNSGSTTARLSDPALVERLYGDVSRFAWSTSDIRLRSYQCEAARAVARSVLGKQGLSLVVMFPRQSGKNEMQAQLQVYLLAVLAQYPAELVHISPTWRPQAMNAMQRLERVLKNNLALQGRWVKEYGYVYRVDRARISFFSGAPESNIVGATASHLLSVDEAQDVRTAKFDKDIAPMAASTNATRVFWGTAWTSRTLLARELRAARAAELSDGIRRAFVVNAPAVAKEVPAYGQFLEGQVSKLGRSHPLVRTQFFSEEIDAEGGMFPPQRLGLMQGGHRLQDRPQPGRSYAMLLDVAGEDEAAGDNLENLRNPGRDATALTIVEVQPGRGNQAAAPVYRVAGRRLWVGVRHTQLYSELRTLAEDWRVRWLVVDATGVGAGLTSFLEKAMPGRVIPFTFNRASKSKLGWDFLGAVDSGRWQEAAEDDPLHAEFLRQLSFCQYEVLPGPGKCMRWGVPDGLRDPASGEPVHDDLVISAALCTPLDEVAWGTGGPALVVPGVDPLREMDAGF
jgi:hypothetical protein